LSYINEGNGFADTFSQNPMNRVLEENRSMNSTSQTLEGAPSSQKSQTPPPRYQLRRVSVKTITQVTPRRRRIVFGGQGLESFHLDYPGQWIKFFFPGAEAGVNSARVYTVLAFDPEKKEMTVDFYLHDQGVASKWAAGAQVGQEIEFAGPAGNFQIIDAKDWYLLVADESALAAMIAIAENLPPHFPAYFFIEVAGVEEEIPISSHAVTHVTWIHRGAGADTSLGSAIQKAQFPAGEAQAWVAGETATVHAIRRILTEEKHFVRTSIHACGYWKRGEADHKDPDSDY
jgi:NADPH-dependent ferric siderophore reductase